MSFFHFLGLVDAAFAPQPPPELLRLKAFGGLHVDHGAGLREGLRQGHFEGQRVAEAFEDLQRRLRRQELRFGEAKPKFQTALQVVSLRSAVLTRKTFDKKRSYNI